VEHEMFQLTFMMSEQEN